MNKGFISLGTIAVLGFVISIAAFVLSIYAVKQAQAPSRMLVETKVMPAIIATPTVEPTATPSSTFKPLRRVATPTVKAGN